MLWWIYFGSQRRSNYSVPIFICMDLQYLIDGWVLHFIRNFSNQRQQISIASSSWAFASSWGRLENRFWGDRRSLLCQQPPDAASLQPRKYQFDLRATFMCDVNQSQSPSPQVPWDRWTKSCCMVCDGKKGAYSICILQLFLTLSMNNEKQSAMKKYGGGHRIDLIGIRLVAVYCRVPWLTCGSTYGSYIWSTGISAQPANLLTWK